MFSHDSRRTTQKGPRGRPEYWQAAYDNQDVKAAKHRTLNPEEEKSASQCGSFTGLTASKKILEKISGTSPRRAVISQIRLRRFKVNLTLQKDAIM